MPEPIDILVVEDVWGPALARLAASYRVERDRDLWHDPARLAARAADARCLVVRNRTQVDRALLRADTRLSAVARAGAGLDNVDVEAADERGVVVVAAGGANARSVAELAIGLAIALARRIVSLDRDVRSGGWDRRPGIELAGLTWGIVGLGRTGRATAELAGALGMRVVSHDPYIPAGQTSAGSLPVRLPLPDLLAQSNVVSLHLPLTVETRHLVDGEFLAAMRPGAYLINLARGEIVDEAALADALTSRQLGGAALDVRPAEPPKSGPLDGLEQLVLTPHIGGLTEAAQDRVIGVICEDLERLLTGKVAEHAVGRARSLR